MNLDPVPSIQPNPLPDGIRKSRPPAEGAIWLRMRSAAQIVDLSPGALRKRLSRAEVPPGVMRRWGRTMLLHKERFLAWVEGGRV